MRAEIVYIADDERRFDNAGECLEYEKTIHDKEEANDWSYTSLIMIEEDKDTKQLHRMKNEDYDDAVKMFDNAKYYVVRDYSERSWFVSLEEESMCRVFGQNWRKEWEHERENIYPEQFGIWFYDMNVDHYVELNSMSLDIDNTRDDILRMI